MSLLPLGENPRANHFAEYLWPFAFDLVLSTLCQCLTFPLELRTGGILGPRSGIDFSGSLTPRRCCVLTWLVGSGGHVRALTYGGPGVWCSSAVTEPLSN